METTAIKAKDLSPLLGKISAESLKGMLEGMKAYRDHGDGIAERYALGFMVDATGDGFTVTYTWCKGEIPGSGYGPDRIDAEPVIGSGRFFIKHTETHNDLVEYVDYAFDVVTETPYDEFAEIQRKKKHLSQSATTEAD